MKSKRPRQTKPSPRRETTATSAAAPVTWTTPDFIEVLACAEIGAYAFRAD